MFSLQCNQAALVVGSFELSDTEVTEGKKVDRVWIARVYSVKSTGEKQSVVKQVVVKMIPDDLAELTTQLVI